MQGEENGCARFGVCGSTTLGRRIVITGEFVIIFRRSSHVQPSHELQTFRRI